MTRKLPDNSHTTPAVTNSLQDVGIHTHMRSLKKDNKNIMLTWIIINCEEITFLGYKTRKQFLEATNYKLTLRWGLKALSSPFWQETLKWWAKWVKAHPKSHNHFGLPSSSLCLPAPAEGSNFKSHWMLGDAEGEWVWLNRKVVNQNFIKQLNLHSILLHNHINTDREGGASFFLQGAAALRLTPTVARDLVFLATFSYFFCADI